MNPLTRIAVQAGLATAVLLSASFGAKAQAIVYTYGYGLHAVQEVAEQTAMAQSEGRCRDMGGSVVSTAFLVEPRPGEPPLVFVTAQTRCSVG